MTVRALHSILSLALFSHTCLFDLCCGRYVMYGLCAMSLGISIKFASAVVFYWCVNNTWSLAQTAVLRVPAVRDACGILPPPAKTPVRMNQHHWSRNKIHSIDLMSQTLSAHPLCMPYYFSTDCGSQCVNNLIRRGPDRN